ncbi:S1C family serine protease [Nigerium massiliense]|uniref:S1C family serine protease n=1 Tax=Nigerium massiliense TaxID=1522317 RepID=UPI000694CE5A|nr:trypsin-like peptidase domain-containing protein [Nigerium massiliense]
MSSERTDHPDFERPPRSGAAPLSVPGQPDGGAPAAYPGGPAWGATPVRHRPRKKRTGLMAVGSVLAVGVLALGVSVPNVVPAFRSAITGQSAPAGLGSGSTGSGGSTASGGVPTDQASSGSGGSSSTTAEASAAQSAGIVLIDTATTSGEAAGTGMVLTASGQVLTNYHVVEGSTAIKVTVPTTEQTYTATVLGHDASRDVALLQLAKASNLTVIRPDTDPLSVGEAVTAVGNANGQGYLSAASGRITTTRTTVTVNSDNLAGSETLRDVMATDAKAQPGDSGGPMLDAQGEVVGMTTAGGTGGGYRPTSATTTSFAIDIDDALAVANVIEAGRDSGTVQVGPNPYLGITVASAQGGSGDRGYGGYGEASSDGVEVNSVTPGTPADTAGLGEGDVITSVGGTRVTSQAELAAALAERQPGQRVTVTWDTADGRSETATVTLDASPIN